MTLNISFFSREVVVCACAFGVLSSTAVAISPSNDIDRNTKAISFRLSFVVPVIDNVCLTPIDQQKFRYILAQILSSIRKSLSTFMKQAKLGYLTKSSNTFNPS